MTIEELDQELSEVIEKLQHNWRRNEDIEDCFPRIVLIALDDFKEAIIKYLKENK